MKQQCTISHAKHADSLVTVYTSSFLCSSG